MGSDLSDQKHISGNGTIDNKTNDASAIDASERLARLALYLGLNCNSAAFHRTIRFTGTAINAFSGCQSDFNLTSAPSLSATSLEDAQNQLDKAKEKGLKILIWGDNNYPLRLLEVPEPPPVLWVRGSILPGDQYAIGLVGSRKATVAGLKMSWNLAHAGAAAGLTIVSGMAKGIDKAAHEGTLAAGGRTLAVLGCGLDHVYPKENAQLYPELADKGALISEFPPEVPPVPGNFPRRNRIIAGLSLAVVVVEASLRSGALITARLALDMNREVMAFPGPPGYKNFEGNNKLIKNGAALVENLNEVLAEIKPRLLEGLLPLAKPSFETPLLEAPHLEQNQELSKPREVSKQPKSNPAKSLKKTKKLSSANLDAVSPEKNSAQLEPAPPEAQPNPPETTPPESQSIQPEENSTTGRLLALLKKEAQDADTLSRQLSLEAKDIAVLLLQLEMEGQIDRLPSGQYQLA